MVLAEMAAALWEGSQVDAEVVKMVEELAAEWLVVEPMVVAAVLVD